MIKVHKYILNFDGITKLKLPKNAEVRVCNTDYRDRFCVWIEEDPEQTELENRYFLVLSDGASMSEGWNPRYVGTIFEEGFVWHIYEIDKSTVK